GEGVACGTAGRRGGRGGCVRAGAGPGAGRAHERLLRAGDDRVEAPGVRLEGHGAEARDRVDDDERATLLRYRRERLDVGDDAGRRLRLGQVDDARRVGVQLGGEAGRVARGGPPLLQVRDGA